MIHLARIGLPAIAAAIMVLTGCNSGPRLVPVSGKITWKGQALGDARVLFQPVESGTLNPGPGSYGRTDSAGRYTLKSQLSDVDGAVPGKHKVQITLVSEENQQADAGGVVNTTIPPEYNSRSTLFFSVPQNGADNADFNLPMNAESR